MRQWKPLFIYVEMVAGQLDHTTRFSREMEHLAISLHVRGLSRSFVTLQVARTEFLEVAPIAGECGKS